MPAPAYASSMGALIFLYILFIAVLAVSDDAGKAAVTAVVILATVVIGIAGYCF